MLKSVLNKSKFYLFKAKCVTRNFSAKTGVEGQEFKDVLNTKTLKKFEDIPGPKCYPVIGTLYKYLPFIGDYDAEALDKLAWLNWTRYGGLVRENPGVNLVHIFEPELIEAVFRQDGKYPGRRSHLAMMHYRLNKPNVYNTGGLLSTNGEEWWRLRSKFQKNFTAPQSVKSHVGSTDLVVKEFISWVKDSGVSSDDDFLGYLNRLNLEVIAETNELVWQIGLEMGFQNMYKCENHKNGCYCGLGSGGQDIIGVVAFDERFNSFAASEQDKNSRSSKTIKAAFGSNSGIMKLDKGILWRYMKTPLYKKLAASQEYLEKLSQDILIKKLNFFENDKSDDDKSLLRSFLEQPDLDLKDITGMMVDILMASVDTTSYSTSFALYHLARNTDCQRKLFDEIETLLPSKDATLKPGIISKAVYLRSCVKESLRLNPVSVGVGRFLHKDVVLKGYLVPKGTVIVTQNMLACRLPQYVRDPFKFKPERWIRDSSEYENIHPFLSLPFGFGPRSCIARRLAEQNICITLIRMVQEFEIEWKGKELGIRTFLINKPDQPISLSFKSR